MRSMCQASLHLAICAGRQMTSPAKEQNHSTSMVNAEQSQTCGHEKPMLGASTLASVHVHGCQQAIHFQC
jgi:hypothetical protein